MHGRTDWSPVIAATDSTGLWFTEGQFGESDFGGWSEVWTVGGKPASPAVQFWVNAPCLQGGQGFAQISGIHMVLTCETAEGRRTSATPSDADPFRTPDGRLVPGRLIVQTPEQYQTETLQYLITSGGGKETGGARIALQSSSGGLGDETADRIMKLIGVNALRDDEMRNVLTIIRAAFERPESIAPSAKAPTKTLLFLRHLADSTDQDSLKKQIAETIAYLQSL